MLENVIKKLKELKIEYDYENDNDAEIVQFAYNYDFGSFPCEFSYDKETKEMKFYSELLEFDQEDREEAILVCQLLNYDTFALKFYMSDENALAGECYIFGDKLTDEQLEVIFDDYETIEETIYPYF